MKISITSTLAALTLSAGMFAGQAQAHTMWRIPPKGGAPYAVPHEHYKPAVRSNSVRKHMHRQGAIAYKPEIVVAHHKSPYHDGLPRTSPPTVPQPKKVGKSAANFGTTDDAALA
ncbi:MAG: hypothetical protein IKE66_14625 [Hyphomicrobium sp.]|nr:hypothetical protein [Hyphomicrobium sp.]